MSYAVALLLLLLLLLLFLIETFSYGNLKKDIRATELKTNRFNFDILTL